jgi:hypothetical protein
MKEASWDSLLHAGAGDEFICVFVLIAARSGKWRVELQGRAASK